MKNKKEEAAKILKIRKNIFYWKAGGKNLNRTQVSGFDSSLGVECNIFTKQHWYGCIAALWSSRVANCWGHLHFWVETTEREQGSQEVLNKFSDLNFLWKFFYVYCYLHLVKQDLYHWHYKNSYIIDFFFQLNTDYYSTISCIFFLNGQQCVLCSSGMAHLFLHRHTMAEESRSVHWQKISVLLRQVFM